ncbi:MAG: 3-keto-5-aminohexanoate cleavage protein [Ardenticatenaceae bacterium]|nr:3-keto-5-aminohexanoate cleavage protein [Ardenticatenaceae bacterium]HBY99120.1 3-keto-5-aminohexanoate cleavage protein [Chloroflexota bacterium]
MSDKVVISAALAGSVPMKTHNPAVPYTPEEFASEAYKAWNEGAAVVHIHARDPETGKAHWEIERFRDISNAIRQRCPDLIINVTTSGRPPRPLEERINRIAALAPEMASFNTNSMNLAYVDWKTGKVVSEFVYENPFWFMERMANAMRTYKTKPEFEIFDFGGLYNVLLLQRRSLFEEPLHFQFVFGVAGGIPYDLHSLARLRELLPAGATWSVCGVSKQQFQAGMTAAANGGHIRVGLEDNIRMPSRELARGSWEQVQWAVQVSHLAGREVASPAEARHILSIPKR